MADLDDSLRADLERLRDLANPRPAAKQRMWTALEHELGPGGADGGFEGSGGGSTSGAKLAFAAKVGGATLGLAGAGLLGLRLAVVGVRALAPAAEVDPAQVDVETETAPADAKHERTSAGDSAVEAGSGTPPSREAKAPARGRTTTTTTARAELDASPSADDLGEDTLEAELALIQEARAASSASSASSALDRHRQRFPRGQLADERELLRLAQLCALDRLDEARAVAEQLRARDRIPAAQIDEKCPALSG